VQPTQNEETYLAALRARIEEVAQFFEQRPLPSAGTPARGWYAYLSGLKAILGNASNALSFVATLMAKEYLCHTLPMRPFDVALKPQGAPGLDIDELTVDGRRVIAEIKTTSPYHANDLGAQQKAAFERDLCKLARMPADHRFLFVTDRRTFEIVRRRYAQRLEGVSLVLLPSGEQWTPSA
jgi:hypothetical protein